MSDSEQRFFDTVAARRLVRPSVRAIILSDDGARLLVQRPADSPPGTSYAFIGGEYEHGDTLHTRLSREIEEETNARLVSWEYLFLVENRFLAGDKPIHALELFCLAVIDREDVVSRERALVQEWLDRDRLTEYDVRPSTVRDTVAAGRLHQTRHLLVDEWDLPQPP